MAYDAFPLRTPGCLWVYAAMFITMKQSYFGLHIILITLALHWWLCATICTDTTHGKAYTVMTPKVYAIAMSNDLERMRLLW